MKNKSFDCVEMKQESQRKLREEFETRRGEFASYFDFLRARSGESECARRSNHSLEPFTPSPGRGFGN